MNENIENTQNDNSNIEENSQESFLSEIPPVNNNYPSIGKAFGLLGVLLGTSLLSGIFAGIIIAFKKEASSFLLSLAYIISNVLTLMFGIMLRRSRKFSYKPGNFAIWPVILIFTILFVFVREPMMNIEIPQNTNFNLKNILESLNFSNPYIFFMIVIAAPILEEFIFRGIILEGFIKRYKAETAIIMSSLIFAIAHLSILQMINAFFIGIFIGWVYYNTRSLTLSIFIHFINNLMAALFSIFQGGSEKTYGLKSYVQNIETYIILYISGIILCASFYYVIKWIFDQKQKVEQLQNRNSEYKQQQL